MPDLKPYIVLGLALGGVFALSGVGLVVLYRATAVLNLAYGALGALGALIAWSLVEDAGWPQGAAYAVAIVVAAVVSLLYGLFFGAAFAQREPLVKAVASLGLLLILLGAMTLRWNDAAYSLTLPSTNWTFGVAGARVNGTQLIALGLGVAVTISAAAFLRWTRLGTAMRALADDRETTAMLGVPVRRVEAVAWAGSGALAGVTGLLLSNLVNLDAATLTFLIVPVLAATLVGRLESLGATLAAALLIGLAESCLTPIDAVAQYRTMIPFVVAILAMLWFSRRRPTYARV